MTISKVIVCPICGKQTLLRIQDGSYLNEYPIRINCINCRALLRGSYKMNTSHGSQLVMINAKTKEPDVEGTNIKDFIFKDIDYVAEISGELPCKGAEVYEGDLPVSPYLRLADNLDRNRIARLKAFNQDIKEWNQIKSIAFNLLSEGSVDYIAKALDNKLGKYKYECDHYLKALHCLQEIAIYETQYLFTLPDQETQIESLLFKLSKLDRDNLTLLCSALGGTSGLLRAYQKIIDIFSKFMDIYPFVLPAETFLRLGDKNIPERTLSTCSLSDIKTFYQDSYEALLSLWQIPICIDNIDRRGNFECFNSIYDDVNHKQGVKSFDEYLSLDNGTRFNKINKLLKTDKEFFEETVGVTANRHLRNAISHNSIRYDGVTQTIEAYDHSKLYTFSLLSMAIDCIELTKSAILFSEIILFLLREEFRKSDITTLVHPWLYDNLEPNNICPCGSGKKYKKCCRNEYEKLE